MTTDPHPVSSLFEPRAIAVIGASRRKRSIGREVLRNLLEGEFQGPVFPVNRSAEVVQSIKAYARVRDIEDPVDLAVIAVPRDHVLAAAKDCAKKGVRGLVVITAGFKEAGKEGAAHEEALQRLSRRTGMRIIGPNCMGIINTADDVRMNASFASARPLPGHVAFATQSGALGEAILADARDLGVGISLFASIGNLVDVSATDLIEYFGNDPRTDVILLYLESFGDPRRFTAIARELARKKPIVVVKSGRSAAGARAAASHTGSLVGRDIAAESLLMQCGVLRANSVAELFTIAKVLATQPMAKGDRVAIVSNAGGPGILATDACAGHGLPLAEFSESTRKTLESALPLGAATSNPVDLIADAGADRFEAALNAVAKDKGVDLLLVVFVSPVTTDSVAVARVIADATRRSGKTAVACFMGKERGDEGRHLLHEAKVPVYRFPEEAASALAAACRYRRFRSRKPGKPGRFEVDREAARKAIRRSRRARRTRLNAADAEQVLAAYGIPLARSKVANSVEEALRFANDVGYPVVLKAESEHIVHKTDVGGVRVGIENGDQLFQEFEAMQQRLRPMAIDLKIQVQKQISGHSEVILGAATDPQFGPLILFGLGGVHVEVLRDVAVRIHPIMDTDADEMIRSIRGYPLLKGARGARPVDLKYVREILLRLSQLISDFEEIEELDLNPVILGGRRREAAVVDARILLRAPE